jgi:hypothetical protein
MQSTLVKEIQCSLIVCTGSSCCKQHILYATVYVTAIAVVAVVAAAETLIASAFACDVVLWSCMLCIPHIVPY